MLETNSIGELCLFQIGSEYIWQKQQSFLVLQSTTNSYLFIIVTQGKRKTEGEKDHGILKLKVTDDFFIWFWL